MTTVAKLAGYAVEFFWGEAVFEMSDSLRRLRKWRLMATSLPLVGLAMVSWTAFVWPQVPIIEPQQSYNEKLAYKRLESLEDVIVEMRIELAIVRHQQNLVGWLIGAAAVGFVGQTFSYFYQLRLRKTLKSFEKREEPPSGQIFSALTDAKAEIDRLRNELRLEREVSAWTRSKDENPTEGV